MSTLEPPHWTPEYGNIYSAEYVAGLFARLAIPEPYPLLIRVRCSCGAKFWSREKYRAHYAVVHHGRPADAHP